MGDFLLAHDLQEMLNAWLRAVTILGEHCRHRGG
jgi:hypothetical protein